MKYPEWLEGFLKDKKEIARPAAEESQAFFDVHRLQDKRGIFWEYARTYTGRLIIRKGVIKSDGVSIVWDTWTTLHDIQFEES
jgi:hypothetical protein